MERIERQFPSKIVSRRHHTIDGPRKRIELIDNRQTHYRKVQVGKDQEKAQSEKRFPLQKPRREKPNQQSGTYTMKTFRKPNGQLFSQQVATQLP